MPLLLRSSLAAALFLAAGGFHDQAFAAEQEVLRVSAAASLADAIKEINDAFRTTTSVSVTLNLGASSTLARQIEAGAPADVFFSADEAKMDGLAAKGLVDRATREGQLSNSLVVVVPLDSTLKLASVMDLTVPGIKKIATGDPKAVPVGVYAKRYLEKAGLWKTIERRIVGTENVRSALTAVESGNAEAGIVYKTDAAVSKKVKVALEIPAMDDLKIIYPVAVLKSAASAATAGRYVDFLDEPASKAVFEKYGFIVLPEAAAAR